MTGLKNYVDRTVDCQQRVDQYIREHADLFELIRAGNQLVKVVWSASAEAEDGDVTAQGVYVVYTDFINNIAVPGKVRFEARHERFWGDGTDYFSPVVIDPTWLDVALYANAMIHTTGDEHHVYLEGINVVGHDNDGVQIVNFSMGS
jgi:hypothetical protein